MPAPTPSELFITYLGPGLSGRRTSIEVVHRGLAGAEPLHSIAVHQGKHIYGTAIEFTLQSDRLQLHVGGRCGAHYHHVASSWLSAVADAFVFVVDSQLERFEANLEMLEWFEARRDGRPVVFQINKRDIPNALPEAELVRRLDIAAHSRVSSIAPKGTGVWEAFEQAALLGARRRGCEALLLELLRSVTGPSPTR